MGEEKEIDRGIHIQESSGRGIVIIGSTKSVSVFSIYPQDNLDVLHKHALDILKEVKE